jgi:heme exporter protein A
MTRINADHIACDRGGRRVFSDVSFTCLDGEWVELRGANGAGKSTLLRCLAGLGEISDGTLAIHGTLHYVGHLDAIKPALTVRENLAFWQDFWNEGNVDVALKAFKLEALADDPASYLSQGQKRRLALSRLVLAKRNIWLLDEPNAGLDTASLARLEQVIATHLAAGGMVIAALHAQLGLSPARTIDLAAA